MTQNKWLIRKNLTSEGYDIVSSDRFNDDYECHLCYCATKDKAEHICQRINGWDDLIDALDNAKQTIAKVEEII